jgi:hypothetical protein
VPMTASIETPSKYPDQVRNRFIYKTISCGRITEI